MLLKRGPVCHFFTRFDSKGSSALLLPRDLRSGELNNFDAMKPEVFSSQASWVSIAAKQKMHVKRRLITVWSKIVYLPFYAACV